MKLNEIYGAGSDDDIPGEKHYGMYYDSLNDAQKIDTMFAPGNNFEIWFTKSDEFRDFSMGLNFLKKYSKKKIPYRVEDLPKTHIKLGSMTGNPSLNSEDQIESIYMALQGDMWSPNGEARNLIRGLGLSHTSMSVGDIIVTNDGKLYFIDSFGYKELHPIDMYEE